MLSARSAFGDSKIFSSASALTAVLERLSSSSDVVNRKNSARAMESSECPFENLFSETSNFFRGTFPRVSPSNMIFSINIVPATRRVSRVQDFSKYCHNEVEPYEESSMSIVGD